eukprot:PhM_4_TR18093/c1_g1_i2/m.49220
MWVENIGTGEPATGASGRVTRATHLLEEPCPDAGQGARGSDDGAGRCPRTRPTVLRELPPEHDAHISTGASGPASIPPRGDEGRDDERPQGGDGVGLAASISGDARTAAEGDVAMPGGRDYVSGNVGECLASRGPGQDPTRSENKRGDDAAVGLIQVGSIWTESSHEVHCLGPTVADYVGIVPPHCEGTKAGGSVPVGALGAARSRHVAVTTGVQPCRDRCPDGSHADVGPTSGDTEVCRPAPISARVTLSARDVICAGGSPVPSCIPGMTWTTQDLEILADVDTELPGITPLPYYPSSTVIRVADKAIREARTRTSAPLDSVSASRIRFDVMRTLPRGDFSPVSEVLTWISTPKILDYIPQSPTEPSVSRHMGSDVDSMLSWGLIREGRGHTLSHMFKVPKREKARLIVDCRVVNDQLPQPPHMPLPDLHELIDRMVSSPYIAQLDARSYFFQFALSGGAENVFGVALGNKRGSFQHFTLQVLPMGFKYAPLIAQTTSNFLLENAGGPAESAAWLDNFLFFGCEDDVKRSVDAFKVVCDQVALELKPEEDGGDDVTALGMRFRAGSSVTLSGENKDAMWEAWKALQVECTPRKIYRVFGTALWALYAVNRTPLCHHETLVSLVAESAPTNRLSWDDRCIPSPQLLGKLKEAVEAALNGGWSAPKIAKPPPVAVWSDASLRALGWVFHGNTAESWASLEAEGESIFLRELLAMVMGARAASKFGTPVLFGDNTAAVHAILKGYSRNKKANVLLRKMAPSCPVLVTWVPTAQQRADPLTRGQDRPAPSITNTFMTAWPRWA